MSGGRPSGPQTAEGDHPSCTSEARKDGETAGCARTPDLIRGKGLVLTEDGAAGPKQERKASALQGWPKTRKGWKPTGRDRHRRARFTTARPEGVRPTFPTGQAFNNQAFRGHLHAATAPSIHGDVASRNVTELEPSGLQALHWQEILPTPGSYRETISLPTVASKLA